VEVKDKVLNMKPLSGSRLFVDIARATLLYLLECPELLRTGTPAVERIEAHGGGMRRPYLARAKQGEHEINNKIIRHYRSYNALRQSTISGLSSLSFVTPINCMAVTISLSNTS
jgi:hypothetical protein